MSTSTSRINFGQLSTLEGVWKQFLHFMTSANESRARRARYKRTFQELARLSDQELREIGISRTNIRRIAKQELLEGSNE